MPQAPTNKLDIARQEIHGKLTSISEQLQAQHEHEREREKPLASSGFSFPIPTIEIIHAAPAAYIYSSPDQSNHDEGYRCKCSFQIVSVSYFTNMKKDTNTDLMYSIRECGNVSPLIDGIFRPANMRIHCAMNRLMDCLNMKRCQLSRSEIDHETGTGIGNDYKFYAARNNLTSVTFVSSWGDRGLNSNQTTHDQQLPGDCHVTLHYGPPGIFQSKIDDDEPCFQNYYNEQKWKDEAQRICNQCNLTSLTARSKGVKITIFNSTLAENERDTVIRDDLWITIQSNGEMPQINSVSLVPPSHNSHQTSIKIQYNKPSTAFQHPNAGVMLSSLHWILNKISQIAHNNSNSSNNKLHLLEMYCGCGAHTIPIAKTIDCEVTAVEMDGRLVDACITNSELNDATVNAVKSDAAVFAKKLHATSSDGNTNPYDVLLVDPPREGLDRTVCTLALQFNHFIYISCGRQALLRDLEILCLGGFIVGDLGVVDLFPGMEGVESLVYLRKGSGD